MLSKVGCLNSSGYLILSNFWAERAYFEEGGGKFSQNSEREPHTFGKKPSETVTGFQLLTFSLRRMCVQMPCQVGDRAFLPWENSFFWFHVYGVGWAGPQTVSTVFGEVSMILHITFPWFPWRSSVLELMVYLLSLWRHLFLQWFTDILAILLCF